MPQVIPSIIQIAEIMGGGVTGAEALVPGPGHSPEDRSLAIKLDSAAADGFVVHSFADDDPIACRDFVKKKLGLPEFIPKKKTSNGGGRPFSPTVAKYVYRLADDTPCLQVQRTAAKEFFQYHWDGENWITGKPKGPKIPYMLPQLIAAAPTAPIYVVEGEKDADNLAKIGFVATCNSEGADNGSGSKWTYDLNQYFKDRHVYIIPDNDALGRKHAEHVARNLYPVAKSVRIVELPGLAPKGDISDWLKSDATGAKLSQLAKAAPLWEPRETTSDEELILELVGLSRLAYAKRRKRAAKDMGIGVGELDRIVDEARGDGSDKGKPALYEHWTVEPWPEPLDGGTLLRALKEAVQRYVFISEDQAVAVTLLTAASWLHPHLTHSPLSYVTSAEKDSGKSTLLGVLNFLVWRGLQSVDISGPALFRSITKWQPTLIVDEADDALADNPDLRSVINSAWTRGQGVMLCHPDTHEPELFSTFAPKIVAMKGRNLPDTTLSRSITITMKCRSRTHTSGGHERRSGSRGSRRRRLPTWRQRVTMPQAMTSPHRGLSAYLFSKPSTWTATVRRRRRRSRFNCRIRVRKLSRCARMPTAGGESRSLIGCRASSRHSTTNSAPTIILAPIKQYRGAPGYYFSPRGVAFSQHRSKPISAGWIVQRWRLRRRILCGGTAD